MRKKKGFLYLKSQASNCEGNNSFCYAVLKSFNCPSQFVNHYNYSEHASDHYKQQPFDPFNIFLNTFHPLSERVLRRARIIYGRQRFSHNVFH